MITRRAFINSLSTAVVAAAAEAQREGNVPRIGYLFLQPWSATGHLREAFRQGLSELGYREGQNIDIEVRNAEGRLERLPGLAAELVQLKVAVIVAAPDPSLQAVTEATKTIPIVMAYSDDPVGRGFVNSLARPGGNITGLSTLGPELYGKQLELLKELVPGASRVVILWAPDYLSHTGPLKEIESAARALGVQLEVMPVQGPRPDFERVFQAATSRHANALLVVNSTLTFANRTRIVDLAVKNRLPAVAGFRETVEAGGLMAYGASIPDMHRRAAAYVDKILKGRKPADLPVERPSKFELAINLKAAKALGLTIPQSLLLRADEVIE